MLQLGEKLYNLAHIERFFDFGYLNYFIDSFILIARCQLIKIEQNRLSCKKKERTVKEISQPDLIRYDMKRSSISSKLSPSKPESII